MTRILTVEVARTAADPYVLTLYGSAGGGQQTRPGSSMPFHEFAELVAKKAEWADFVCVDETGLGAALVDLLAKRGIGVLRTRRGAPLEEPMESSAPSALDWSEMCDAALAVRRRFGPTNMALNGEPAVVLTEKEATALVCAALEYSNRLAHEHSDRLRRARAWHVDCACSPEWRDGAGCPVKDCVRRKA